jgi:amino acid adenylation domain-containing protein
VSVVVGGPDWVIPADVRLVTLEQAASQPPLAAPASVSDDALAYVIFTSGSTGEPKGVQVSHRAAVNTIEDVCARFDVRAGDRVLAVSALDFDLSVFDVFGLWSVGGAAVLVAEDLRRDARAWLRLVRTHGVTVWNSVPALLDMLLVAAGDEDLGALRLALVSGDWVGLDLRERLTARQAGARLIALGGATEAAIWSNFYEVGEIPAGWRSIPYGAPLRNQMFRVVDQGGRDCPDWVAGELWIGGVGVAAGYRGDPERSAARFVIHEDVPWYRTGDLGRYWPDGTLEFLGRSDLQVKIRGHRIELGEIEAALQAYPGVRDAVVVTAGGRRAQLAAAIVGSPATLSELTEFLAAWLPSYMIPERVVVFDELPLSANGKVDRDAIRQQLSIVDSGDDEPPRPGLETTIAELWRKLLEVESVGRFDNFFRLGGDSLLATGVVEALRVRYGVEVALRMLFERPTIADLAVMVSDQIAKAGADPYEEGEL